MRPSSLSLWCTTCRTTRATNTNRVAQSGLGDPDEGLPGGRWMFQVHWDPGARPSLRLWAVKEQEYSWVQKFDL